MVCSPPLAFSMFNPFAMYIKKRRYRPNVRSACLLITRFFKIFPVKIRTKVIPTFGMHCSGCEETVTNEIMKLEGIKSVKADHVNKTVTVKYDDKKVTLEQVKLAIVNAGYKLSES